MAIVNEAFLIELLQDVVKEADHLYWEVDKLVVQFAVKFLEVSAIDFEDSTFQELQVVQLVTIDEFGHLLTLQCEACVLEAHDESFQKVHDLLGGNVGAVDGIGFLTILRSGVVHVLWGSRVVWAKAVGHVEVGA